MHGWLTVARKDLREMWRDRRVLIGVFVMPLFLMFLFVVTFGVIGSKLGGDTTQKVGMVGGADDGFALRLRDGGKRKVALAPFASLASALASLEDGQVKVVVERKPGWDEAVASGQAVVVLHYDQNAPSSQVLAATVRRKVEEENLLQAQSALRQAGSDPALARPVRTQEVNTSKAKGIGASSFASLLPYLIVLFAFTAAASSAADLVAGEKERGTMETLLVSPPSRTALALGKVASLGLVSLVGGLVAVVSLALVGLMGLGGSGAVFPKGMALPLGSVLAMLCLLVPLALMYAGTMVAVSSAARSMREAQSYLAVMNLLVMAPAVASQVVGVTGMEKSAWVAWVPVLNTAVGLQNALAGQGDGAVFAGSVVTCLLVAAVGVAGSVRAFTREGFLRRV